MNPSTLNPKPSTDLVSRLLTTIRGQFCGDLTQKQWCQATPFLKRRAILWPALFMDRKGFTLPAARYESIMRNIFQTIKHHGRAENVHYWPAYLAKCVQDHWHHHWEEYYGEAKSARSLAEAALLACKPVAASDPTVHALALAHKVLTSRKRHPSPSSPSKQLDFQGL